MSKPSPWWIEERVGGKSGRGSTRWTEYAVTDGKRLLVTTEESTAKKALGCLDAHDKLVGFVHYAATHSSHATVPMANKLRQAARKLLEEIDE